MQLTTIKLLRGRGRGIIMRQQDLTCPDGAGS